MKGRVIIKMFPAAVFIAAAAALIPAPASGQDRGASIGYIYPAGGQQGTSVQLIIGGQHLRGASSVHFSGSDIKVLNVEFVQALNNRHLRELRLRLKEIRVRRAAAARGEIAEQPERERVDLPDHPMLRNLEEMTAEELRAAADFFLDPKRTRQVFRSIMDIAAVEIEIPEDALPGRTELRVRTSAGLTNPMGFYVGTVPEVMEKELNDLSVSSLPALEVPVVINGRIMQGDADRFLFSAREGQNLVISVHARRLVPYLADGVPGWFQAVLYLYGPDGREVAYSDDYRNCPDPVILYRVPRDGEYTVEIRDAIYRGREDFVYRISIGETPFITHVFPAGGAAGGPVNAHVYGWNLPSNRVELNTGQGQERIRETVIMNGGLVSNSILYAVDGLPELFEEEPNDSPGSAGTVSLPTVLNGRIGKPGDIDVFRFTGKDGDEVAAEVYARRLGSPLDSLLRLTDSAGRVIAWNDDMPDAGSGLNTHHADSYIRCKLPSDGQYLLHISDALGAGGEEYVYRLRISQPMPDFELRVVPSSITAPAGTAVPVVVHAVRRDGFKGEIEVEIKDALPGYKIDGGVVPEGADSARMTLTVPLRQTPEPVELEFIGRALVDGKEIARRGVPADDMMQAFGYRHLVPSGSLMAVIAGPRGRPPALELESAAPADIPEGGELRLRFRSRTRARLSITQVELSDPPAGISLGGFEAGGDYIELTVRAASSACGAVSAGNIIAALYTEQPAARDGPPVRRYAGLLPAVPYRVIRQ